MNPATKAYAAVSSVRSLREQEADVFRRVIGSLKIAREPTATPIQIARAIADTRLLWSQVEILMSDDSNRLPIELRASIISVGKAVDREASSDSPDLNFLIDINENIAAGLSGR
jgi:flagellar biosynthesis regulator FlaF